MIDQPLGPYRVLEQIGAGAMGIVFRARDSRLDRDVALKVLPASALGDESARRRLLHEAKTASALNHPNICAIYDVGEADGQVYIAMDLVQGRLLSADLGRDPSELPRMLRLGIQLTDALEHAHDRGVVHRDLKPSNIISPRTGTRRSSTSASRRERRPPASTRRDPPPRWKRTPSRWPAPCPISPRNCSRAVSPTGAPTSGHSGSFCTS